MHGAITFNVLGRSIFLYVSAEGPLSLEACQTSLGNKVCIHLMRKANSEKREKLLVRKVLASTSYLV